MNTFTPSPTATALPGNGETVINYTYDKLNRLTAADSSDGTYYHYTYDEVGNRKSETTQLGTTSYLYDIANRLTSVGGVTYTYDNNGNLLNDGVNTYTYDSANRLKTISNQTTTISYAYNGLGDRLQETVNGMTTTFAMDLNAGLTQALSDGTHDYIYGNGRIAQVNGADTEYFLTDALGSVRQLTDSAGAITFAQAYDPYGAVNYTAGSSVSSYGFTNEYQNSYIKLIYLRSRMYSPLTGRFLTRDSWQGDYNRPLSLNRWNYTEGNPINYTDPSGLWALAEFKKLDSKAPDWTQLEKQAVNNAVTMVAMAYAKAYNQEMKYRALEECDSLFGWLWLSKKIKPDAAFYAIHGGPITFWHLSDTSMKFFEPKEREFDDYNEYLRKHKEYWQNPKKVWGQKRDENDIYIFSNYSTAQLENDLGRNTRFFMHEIGHAFNHAVTSKTSANPYSLVTGDLIDPNFGGYAGKKLDWQFSSDSTAPGEYFADMFIGWVYQQWGVDEVGVITEHGQTRRDFMNDNMPLWIADTIGKRR
jgi:RHS repeat-associated protein